MDSEKSSEPWRVKRTPKADSRLVVDDSGIVAEVFADDGGIEANLIAAAPELLVALQDLAQYMAWHLYGECRGFSDRLIGGPEAMAQAQAAIAKATGMQANAALSGSRPGE